MGDVLKRDPYSSNVASRQGYYHCEVQVPGSKEKYSSPKLKFFYSGKTMLACLIYFYLMLTQNNGFI